MSEYKVPKKGAVARLRELYKQKRQQQRTPQELDELREVFKKKDSEPSSKKKIARGDRDLESP
jgi:hypothetical protein